MGRSRKAYSLYKRFSTADKSRGNEGVWYFRTYDKAGNRTTGRTTGEASKAKADAYCQRLFQTGKLGFPKAPTLQEFVNSCHFFEWEGDFPECKYSKERLSESKPGTPLIQKAHVRNSRKFMENHILPYFGITKIDLISQKSIKEWRMDLIAEGLAHKTINNIASVFRVILKQAIADGIILKDDPFDGLRKLGVGTGREGSLSQKEALLLMNPQSMQAIWNGNRLHYLLNLSAMISGSRASELLGMRKENLFIDHFSVSGSWKRMERKKGVTKTKKARFISIPEYLYNELTAFCTWDGFVFSTNYGVSPVSINTLPRNLYAALANIGLDADCLENREINFHAWRRFANSYMRNFGVPDAKVRELTGHATEAMTSHYMDWTADSFRDVVKAQENLIQLLKTSPEEIQ
ncbi:MAG: tyrosine-type recombinase/integrase [Rectinemataceae bacterium]